MLSSLTTYRASSCQNHRKQKQLYNSGLACYNPILRLCVRCERLRNFVSLLEFDATNEDHVLVIEESKVPQRMFQVGFID